MSDVVKSSAIWNGLKVDSYTNVRTGEISLYQPKRLTPVLLARSIPANGEAKWSYEGNGANFRNIYNDQQRAIGGKELSQEEFNQQFFTKGTTAFNNIRGTILRTESNYVNAGIPVAERELIKKGHFDNRVPGSVDPASDIMVNSDGTLPDRRTSGEDLIQRDPIVPTRTGPGPGGAGEQNENLRSLDEINGDIESLNSDNNAQRVNGSVTLKYPLHEPPSEFQYDYIRITARDYGRASVTEVKLGPARETVWLPMQPQLSETNAVSWSDDQLNPVQAALGDFAIGAIQGLGGGGLGKIGEAFNKGLSEFKAMATNPATKSFATAYFAGQAVGANLVGRTTGMVINPNLELLFNGPNLRTFNFNFRLTPRSEEESKMIRKIIRAFKRNSAVQKGPDKLFLKSPRVFELEYQYKGGQEHPYLNKFKPCALTNFSVNYTPDGSYATFDKSGSLTAYELNMDFTEIVPIYEKDIPAGDQATMGF